MHCRAAACCPGQGTLCAGALPHIGSAVRSPAPLLCRGLCAAVLFSGFGVFLIPFFLALLPNLLRFRLSAVVLVRGSQSPSLSPSPELCMLQRCLQLLGSWHSALQGVLCAPENRLLMLICSWNRAVLFSLLSSFFFLFLQGKTRS